MTELDVILGLGIFCTVATVIGAGYIIRIYHFVTRL